MTEPAALFELRLYQAVPGGAGALTELFEAVFLDAYEAAGARIEGSFIDCTQADRWVWIRSFASATERGEVLGRFYGSAVWQQYRADCSALMTRVEAAFLLGTDPAHPVGLREVQSCAASEWSLQINPLARPLETVATQVKVPPTADLVTHTGPNSYPRQPVRRTPVRVTLRPALPSDMATPDTAPLHRCLRRLRPTPRSRLGGAVPQPGAPPRSPETAS